MVNSGNELRESLNHLLKFAKLKKKKKLLLLRTNPFKHLLLP